MIDRMPVWMLARELEAARKRSDGYIMGATGQNPMKWGADSWWYKGQYSGKQLEKALYWRTHADRVWDCNGMAEGIYKDYSGVDINTRARYNYRDWCSSENKGEGMIPASKRVKGAAVFWGEKASKIHHVGYLIEPVKSDHPEGDWYLVEARGVMYGVVRTRLYSRKPNFWGWMDKYFDYDATEEPVSKTPSVQIEGGSCYVRSLPSKKGEVLGVARDGDVYPYIQENEPGWELIEFKGQNGWVSSKYGKIK